MEIKLTGFKKADMPTGATLVLAQGPDAYVGLRSGQTVDLVLDDGTISGLPVTATAIGPLLNFFSMNMMAMPQHFAMRAGQDARVVVDALEKMYPGDAKAIDPRTIYSSVTVTFPMQVAAMVAPIVAPAV